MDTLVIFWACVQLDVHKMLQQRLLQDLPISQKLKPSLYMLTMHTMATRYCPTHSLTSVDGAEWSASCPSSIIPRKESVVLIGWAPGSVWTFRRIQISSLWGDMNPWLSSQMSSHNELFLELNEQQCLALSVRCSLFINHLNIWRSSVQLIERH
jgi:hypothetical protein